MSRSKAKPRRSAPDPPVSYMDGVPMKLSDAFRRPQRVALPLNVVVNDLDNVLREFNYDFSLEESVVRNAEEQRRVWQEVEKNRKDQEEAAAKKAKEEADAAAAAEAAAAAASSKPASPVITPASTPNDNNNSSTSTATRPTAIQTGRPQVPPRPHPSSLPSPLLREVTAEKILQPKTVESASVNMNRPPASSVTSTSLTSNAITSIARPSTSTVASSIVSPPTSVSSTSTVSSRLTTTTNDGATAAVSSAFNVADWERCEDPFEIVERRTINVMDELKSVLESASSSAIVENETTESTSSPTTDTDVAAVTASAQPSAVEGSAPSNLESESRTIETIAETAESSSAEAEVLSNVERPPSYDEVVGEGTVADDQTASSLSVSGVAAASEPGAETVVMSLQNLKLTPASSALKQKRGEPSSPSTPASSGASGVSLPVADESRMVADCTSPNTFLQRDTLTSPSASSSVATSTASSSTPKPPSSLFVATTPTTPTASYPEYVSLPDFPSLSEADLPFNPDKLDDSDLSATGPVFSETTPKVIQSTEGASSPAASTPLAAESTSNASYDKLSTPLRVLVDKLVDMGFDLGVTSRAADHFGSDEKQIIDHLCAVSLLSEEGHSVIDAEEALFFNEGKEKLARKFLKALDQLRQFGFEDGKIKAALVASGNDTDKALDQLMVT